MQLVRLSLLKLPGRKTTVMQRDALADCICAHLVQNLRAPQLLIDGISRVERHLAR